MGYAEKRPVEEKFSDKTSLSKKNPGKIVSDNKAWKKVPWKKSLQKKVIEKMAPGKKVPEKVFSV